MKEINNLIYAPITLLFDFEDKDRESFRREYDLAEQSEDDPIGHWLKVAKAKGDARDTDKLLLQLIMELHRKVDQLSEELKGKAKQMLTLSFEEAVDSINYTHLRLKEQAVELDRIYYGRIIMPTFPRREIPIYAQGVDGMTVEIKLMHDRDRADWDAYVASRERSAIRQARREKFEWE
jgi:hypothetical protein